MLLLLLYGILSYAVNTEGRDTVEPPSVVFTGINIEMNINDFADLKIDILDAVWAAD